jgi:putative ATP-binding cassette transporter
MARFAQELLIGQCEELSEQVISTPFQKIEKIGPARILSTLTADVQILASAIQVLPSLAGNIAILTGCFCYLTYLSWRAALIIFLLTCIGALLYNLQMKRAYKAIFEARVGRDTLFKHFRSLTEGIKEIKMSLVRQRILIEEEIFATTNLLREKNLTATIGYLKADGAAQIMFFLLIGLLLFLTPYFKDASMETLTGYVLVTLYSMTPVWGIINVIPTLHRGEAAMERIEKLGFSLDHKEYSFNGENANDKKSVNIPDMNAPTIQLKGVKFSYHEELNVEKGFSLGPIDLKFPSGKLIFVIGGNGSGKTTLLKLLVGLYSPKEGSVLVDNRPVTSVCQSYRELFSAVFSDYYLFDRVATSDGTETDQKAEKYFDLLQLKEKVSIKNSFFSTTNLSQGQRRRLALLSAYLEDRPVYVFDEWAADQDPDYKEVFYKHLLVELKARGKTVIVITHDDRYFHIGDMVVRLDYGKIIECWDTADQNGMADNHLETASRLQS